MILIDHSRAFRNFGQLRAEGDLTRFSRSLLEAMEKLDRPTLIKLVSQYLTPYQIDALLQPVLFGLECRRVGPFEIRR